MVKKYWLLGLLVAASVCLNSCARLTALPPPPPPPPPLPTAGADPDAVTGREGMADSFAKVPVFYATDRNRAATMPLTYGTDREPASQLHLGKFVVSVPRDHRMGEIERPTILSFYREDPNRHFVIVTRTELEYAAFYRELRDTVGKSGAKQAFVFIHGYRVPFEDALYRTAQLAYDLGFDGAPILYSWPSQGTLTGYRIDERNNEWTVNRLRWFLEDVRQRSGAQVVHLIAHSMGNRALTAALAQMRPSPPPAAQFQQIVLAAPDIDVGLFPDLAAAMKRLGARITLYASDHDLALVAAKEYDTFQRVGSTTPHRVIIDGLDTIDASEVDTSLLGHSYVGDSKRLLSDLFYVIRGVATGIDPRKWITAQGTAPSQYWMFRPAGGPN